MIKGLYTTEVGMSPKLVRMEIIANNLANINTTGFKRDNAFTKVLDDAAVIEEVAGNGTDQSNTEEYTDFSEGSLKPTNNPLDIALQGRGFLVVDTPNGPRYTRNGNLQLSLDGTLVTSAGYPVQGTSGKIQFPDIQKLQAGSIGISETGEVMVDKLSLGHVRIVDFADYRTLHKDQASMFVPDLNAVLVEGPGKQTAVRQGHLEDSNVDGMSEMIEMIELNRSFEADQKALQSQNATLAATNEVGKL
ncbi:MAG: flagellar hook-basal body protein [Bacteroidota bacterium]